MAASTPLSTTKTAALCRTLDAASRGYMYYTKGTVVAHKVLPLAKKFHLLYGIGCTPSQRHTKKLKGQANTSLVIYQHADETIAEWLLLATNGSGAVHDNEQLKMITMKPRLMYLGYELVRHSSRGKSAWTWRRPKLEMADWYALLTHNLQHHNNAAVHDLVTAIARQPGFHGVREQSKNLFNFVKKKGYFGELPNLYYVHKISHGNLIYLESQK